MTFDPEGHLCITPEEVFAQGRANPTRLINDVLWQGTPRTFDTHQAYRDFVHFVAGELSVHPACIVFRGSTRLGFSMTPRSGKIWVESTPGSDVDLAIVDPDHFHFLDAEVRRWERHRENSALFSKADLSKIINLQRNRSSYCYRPDDLPDTELVRAYKKTMIIATLPASPGCGRDVTAFFYRDWWSLYSREERDIRDILERTRIGNLLPAGRSPRPWLDWSDDDLTKSNASTAELVLSSMARITDAGLARLDAFRELRALWLDDMEGISDAGLEHVGKIEGLRLLSVCTKSITDKGLAYLHELTKLERLYYDRSSRGITKEALSSLASALPKLTIYDRAQRSRAQRMP